MQEAYGLTSQQLLHDITTPRLKQQLTRKQGTLKPLYFYIATWNSMHLSRRSEGANIKQHHSSVMLSTCVCEGVCMCITVRGTL